MGIGKLLERLIREHGTNVHELATETNVNPSTIYSIIRRDNTKIDIDILIKICNFLNVSVEEFYQEIIKSEEPQQPNVTDIVISDKSVDRDELINLLMQLSDDDLLILKDVADYLLWRQQPKKTTTTIYRAARSADHHAAEIVETTKDFSKFPKKKDRI